MTNFISVTVIPVLLVALRIIQPFFAILILYMLFTSMREQKRDEQPLIMLMNMVNHDSIPIVYWENSIGRSKTADIALNDPTISRNHAVLYRRDEGWIIADCGSKSGVMVNGERIYKPTTVYLDDVIAIGATPLVLKTADSLNRRKQSWFFDKGVKHKVPGAAIMLFLVTLFHFQATLQLCLAKPQMDFKYILPFLAFTAAGWGLYLISSFLFKRTAFELETIGFFLSGIGIIIIEASSYEGVLPQTAALVLGMVLYCFMLWFMEIPDRAMRWRIIISLAAVGILAVNLLIGSTVNGSKNWIVLGPISIQPSEFVKIALILVGTSTLARLQTTKNLTEFIVFSVICIGALFLMGDFGTACIFFVTFVIVAFMRSGDIRTIVFIIAAAALGAFIILQFKPYIADRFAVWRHAWEYIDTTGYQQTRVMSYSASGGLFGVGLGKGYLKTIFASSSDLVFGMLCEEMGIMLAAAVAVCMAALAFYSRAVSSTSRSTLYSIAACSAAGLLVFQSALNIFGATDILPMTGVTLPFVSMGGSSLMAVWGLLSFIKAADERTYSQKRGFRE